VLRLLASSRVSRRNSISAAIAQLPGKVGHPDALEELSLREAVATGPIQPVEKEEGDAGVLELLAQLRDLIFGGLEVDRRDQRSGSALAAGLDLDGALAHRR
jgi:hypothetical protein